MLSALYRPEWLRILKGLYYGNIADMTKEQAEEFAFTEKELEELERARNVPITFDEDCPETTLEKFIPNDGKTDDSQSARLLGAYAELRQVL